MSGPIERAEWLDRDIHGPAFYAYAIQAVDSAGNASERTPPLLVRVTAPKPQQAVNDVVATLAEDGRVRVDWSAKQEHVQHFVVYRSRDGAAPVSVGHVAPAERRFTDERLPGKGSYAYSVKAVHLDGSVNLPVAALRPVEVR